MARTDITFNIENKDITGFASNVTGINWTLSNNNVTSTYKSLGDTDIKLLSHKIIITNDSSTNHSAKTAILIGIDQDGHEQTETLNLPSGSASVSSAKYFKTLSSITPSSSIGSDTMDIGWDNAICSSSIPCNYNDKFATNPTISVTKIGDVAINYTVQQTLSTIQVKDRSAIVYFNSEDNDVLNSTATAGSTYLNPPTAIRVIVNSYTNGAGLGILVVN